MKLIVPRVEKLGYKNLGFDFKNLWQIVTNLWMFDTSSLHIQLDVPWVM